VLPKSRAVACTRHALCEAKASEAGQTVSCLTCRSRSITSGNVKKEHEMIVLHTRCTDAVLTLSTRLVPGPDFADQHGARAGPRGLSLLWCRAVSHQAGYHVINGESVMQYTPCMAADSANGRSKEGTNPGTNLTSVFFTFEGELAAFSKFEFATFLAKQYD